MSSSAPPEHERPPHDRPRASLVSCPAAEVPVLHALRSRLVLRHTLAAGAVALVGLTSPTLGAEPPSDAALSSAPLTRDQIIEKLIAIVADQLDAKPEDVTPDKHIMNDLQADSLACVELLLAVEECFGLKIPDETAETLVTVRLAADYIEKHQKK